MAPHKVNFAGIPRTAKFKPTPDESAGALLPPPELTLLRMYVNLLLNGLPKACANLFFTSAPIQEMKQSSDMSVVFVLWVSHTFNTDGVPHID
jgi:hypothetical protein